MEIYQGRSFKVYRGMGSITSMNKGSKDRYFQDGSRNSFLRGLRCVPFKGALSETVFQMLGGVRSGMDIAAAGPFPACRKAKFIRITGAGLKEPSARYKHNQGSSNYSVGV